MVLGLCFCSATLVCFCVLVFALHISVLLALLISAAFFLLLHFLFVLFFWLISLPVPADQPIDRRHPLICWGVANGISVLDFYFGVRLQITGLEKIPSDGRFLYVCNHRSAFDPVIVMDKLRRYEISFISKPSNMAIPMIGRVGHAAGYLGIDRENDRNALRTILTAADYMKCNFCSIGIYPEGTRSKTKELLPFHSGSLKIAQKAKAPIVVACCQGSENIKRLRIISGTKVRLDILETIPAETVCSMKTTELSAHIVDLIQQHLDRTKEAETA